MIIKTDNFEKGSAFINELISKNAIGAIIGEKGSGKSFIREKVVGALEDRRGQYTVIDVGPIGEDVKNITSIMSALIEDIAGESPRRDIEARRRQLRRILGEADLNKRVIILAIDEAQDLHKSTLRGLKKIHELGVGTRTRLFTTILFAQPSLIAKISCNELRPRIKKFYMKGLTKAEKKKFIPDCDLFTEKALDIFITSVYGTPLAIENAYNDLNDLREQLAQKKIDEKLINNYLMEDVIRITFSSNRSLRRLADDIFTATGHKISATTLSQVRNNKYNGNLAGIKAILNDYIGSDEAKAAQ